MLSTFFISYEIKKGVACKQNGESLDLQEQVLQTKDSAGVKLIYLTPDRLSRLPQIFHILYEKVQLYYIIHIQYVSTPLAI